MREQQSISWSNHAQVQASACLFVIHMIAIKQCSRRITIPRPPRAAGAGRLPPRALPRRRQIASGSTRAPPVDRELACIAEQAGHSLQQERNINILETRNFGRLGFVEVGALSVGRIVQVHPLDVPFQRGEEKSVFRFGGSAIVVFGEPGAWRRYERVRHSELAQHRANCSKKAEVIFREIGSVTGAKRLGNFALRFDVESSIGFAQSEPPSVLRGC